MEGTIRQLRSSLGFVGIVGLIATLAMAWIAVGYGLRPIDEAAIQIAAIRADTLTERVDEGARQPRELRPLLKTINRLLQRLQSTFDRERAFSSDVAHELRTPLAGLRAKIDVALSKPRTAGDYEQTLQQCLMITEQTSKIVESLLATTRPTIGSSGDERIDIRSLIVELADEYEDRISERSLTLQSEMPDGAELEGPLQTITMLFRNLVDNAISYADTGSTIHVQGHQTPQEATFQLSNSASDFPAGQITKVFERFWRADLARTDTGQHSGLGLPLCKRLAESIGGTIETSCENQVFAVRLRFGREATTSP